jgi:hypothetical protein
VPIDLRSVCVVAGVHRAYLAQRIQKDDDIKACSSVGLGIFPLIGRLEPEPGQGRAWIGRWAHNQSSLQLIPVVLSFEVSTTPNIIHSDR